MNLKSKFAASLATASLLMGVMAPAVFADNTIVGNGTESTNKIVMKYSSDCTVKQTNNTTVSTVVDLDSNTGNNTANKNTNGDVTVKTGDITNDVTVVVEGSTNEATDPCCGCVAPFADPNNKIKENGAGSTNTVKVKMSANKKVTQKNSTLLATVLALKSKTGKNKANSNTGPGSFEVTSGDVSNTVDVSVTAPSNTL